MRIPGRSERDLTAYAQALSEMAQGGTNALGEVALVPGETSTTVADSRAGADSTVHLMPLSAAAAAATVWLEGTDRGTFTLGHDASGAERRFRYEVRRP